MSKIKQYLELIIDIMLVIILTAWIISIIQDCCGLNKQKQIIINHQEKIIQEIKIMKKTEARRKAMQIIAVRSANPNRLTVSRIIKDQALIKDLQQIIPNSQLYYSADTDKIYTIISDKVMQIGLNNE